MVKHQKLMIHTYTQNPRHLKLITLVISYRKLQESGLIEITPLMCILTV